MHIVLILSIIIIGMFFNKKPKMNVVLCAGALFLYAGLRASSVGIDTQGYENAFYYLRNISFSDIPITNIHGISRNPVFYYFLKTLQFISNDSQIMFITIGAIVAISISWFIYNYSENITLSFLIFVGLRFFYFTLTGLRAALAISIILFAYKYLEKKDYIKVVILTVIASLFHTSAIIFIFAIFIDKIKKSKILFIVVLIIFAINILLNNAITYWAIQLPLLSQYSSYVLNPILEESGLTVIFIFLITFIGYYFSTLSKSDKKNLTNISSIFLKHLFIGISFYIINFFYANAFRMGHYFIISIVALMPNIINNLKLNKKVTYLIKIVAIILLTTQYIIIGPGRGTENYLFFWQI